MAYTKLAEMMIVNDWEKGLALELNDIISLKLRLSRLGFQTRLVFDMHRLPLLTVYRKGGESLGRTR